METYTPHPKDTSGIILLPELLELKEQIATNVHDVWAAGKIAEGWTYNKEHSNKLKHHPSLVPYEQLSESEKEYDRNTAMETLKVMLSLGFKIVK